MNKAEITTSRVSLPHSGRNGKVKRIVVSLASSPCWMTIQGETYVGFLAYRVNRQGEEYGLKPRAYLVRLADLEEVEGS